MNNQNNIRVKEIMSNQFKIMSGRDTVQAGLQVMKDSDIRTLIIDKRTDEDAYGMVLLSDIAKKVLAKNRSRSRTNLYEIMSKPVLSVEPNLDIRYCARLFNNFGLSIAPVLNEGQIVGIVSYSEIVLDGLIQFS